MHTIRKSGELKPITTFHILVSERRQMLVGLLDLLEKVCPGKGEEDRDLRKVTVEFCDCRNFSVEVKLPPVLENETDQQSWAAVAKYAEEHEMWVSEDTCHSGYAGYTIMPALVSRELVKA